MDYQDFPLFSNLDRDQLSSVLSACREITIPAGTTFIEEGEQGDRLFLLTHGQVTVFLSADGGSEHELAIISAPAVIGELEALTGERRSASVRSRSDVHTFELPFETVTERLRQGDQAMLVLFLHTARIIAHRLTAMNRKFAELRQAPAGPRFHELRDFQEKLLNEWTV